jgi:hypothetical protein
MLLRRRSIGGHQHENKRDITGVSASSRMRYLPEHLARSTSKLRHGVVFAWPEGWA